MTNAKVFVLLRGDYGEQGYWPTRVYSTKEAAEASGHKLYDFASPWTVEEYTVDDD